MTADIKCAPTVRISSIDLLRGIVMIIMALDHTRDFFHITAMTANPLDPAITTGPLFFTRWITHFCAPIFVFLSGLSAYLSAQKKKPAEARKFWIRRGLWLIAVELVIVTLGLTFNPFYNFIVLQVIWAIGVSMILLALVSRISVKAVLITGLILVFGHDILNHIDLPKTGVLAGLINILFTSFGTFIPINSNHTLGIFYAILPWTGIMFIGYASGTWFTRGFSPAKRISNLLFSGLTLLCLFIALRLLNVYGDQAPRREYGDIFRNFLSFINVSKYPPSLAYTCMTVGTAMIFLAVFENVKGRLVNIFSVYGNVPFFYYVVHFYLLHLVLVIVFYASGHNASQIVPKSIPFFFRVDDYGFNLPIVYAIWLTVVAILYRPCLWFKKYKETHTYGWLKYT